MLKVKTLVQVLWMSQALIAFPVFAKPAKPVKADKKGETKAETKTPEAKGPVTVVELNSSKSEVEFRAIGKPSFLKVNGKGTKLKGDFEIQGKNVTGESSFPLETLDTGIDLRNKHMKEKYLEIKTYPEAKFTLTHLVLPSELKNESAFEQLAFTGTLSLRGKTQTVSGKVDISRSDRVVSIMATFKTKISLYGIPEPGFKGVTVADEVDVYIRGNGNVK